MVRPGQAAEPKPLPIDRAKQLTKPFAGDDALDTWAAKMLADSEAFQSNKRSDPLGGFLVTHERSR
jgi:hypothetical protein